MSNYASRISPLAHLLPTKAEVEASEESGVRLSEQAFLGHINLRGEPSNRTFLSCAESMLGVGLPLKPNTIAAGAGATILWLGPDEWLVLTAPCYQQRLAIALRDALKDLLAAVTDVSSGQTVINIRGKHARDVLNKGCTLDLHPRVFGLRQCAQTNVAKTAVTIWKLDELPSYAIIVRRSFAHYLAYWLTDAAREYDLVANNPESSSHG